MNVYQVKAFNGNRIQVTYSPEAGNTFATIKTVKVDNVRPALITQSPAIPLIVRGNTDVTFSADFTDGGAGFDAKFDGGLGADLGPHGLLNDSGSRSQRRDLEGRHSPSGRGQRGAVGGERLHQD